MGCLVWLRVVNEIMRNERNKKNSSGGDWIIFSVEFSTEKFLIDFFISGRAAAREYKSNFIIVIITSE
jgi:hypothetical protein